MLVLVVLVLIWFGDFEVEQLFLRVVICRVAAGASHLDVFFCGSFSTSQQTFWDWKQLADGT